MLQGGRMDPPELVSPLLYVAGPTSNPWASDATSPTFSIPRSQGIDGIELVREETVVSRSSESRSAPESRNASIVPSESTRLSSVSEWNEEPFAETRMIGKPEVFQIKVPFKDPSVGLSNDCTSVYFFKERSIAIYSLASVQTLSANQSCIKYKLNDDTYLREVAASEHYVAILTDQSLMLFKYDFSCQQLELQGSIPMEWDPRGLAIHENHNEILLLVGERRQRIEGRVNLYRYVFSSNPTDKIQRVRTFEVVVGNKTNDVPKLLAFHPNGKTFACVTGGRLLPSPPDGSRRREEGIKKSVLVWSIEGSIEEDMPVVPTAFEVSHTYTAETEAGGITAAALFDSPSGKRYVLSTSSPSSERSRNDGEWSFISPVDCSSILGPPPPHLIHRFVQLKDRLPLTAGAVHMQGNMVALLERTGKIILIPLIANDHGGLCSANSGGQDPAVVPVSLCTQARLTMGCLRFDPPGALLYAIDSRGKVIRTCFRQHVPQTNLQTHIVHRPSELVALPLRQLDQVFELDQREPSHDQACNNGTTSSSTNIEIRRRSLGHRALLRRVFPSRSREVASTE